MKFFLDEVVGLLVGWYAAYGKSFSFDFNEGKFNKTLNLFFQSIVMYLPPSIYSCTARVWLREIGFSLTYGALMLKTWR